MIKDDPFKIKIGDIKDNDLSKSSRSAWTEDHFIGLTRKKEPVNSNIDNLGNILSKSRINFLIFAILVALFFLIVKFFYINIIKGSDYRSLAEGNRIRITSLQSTRGIIFDRNMKPLVENKPIFILSAVPADLPNSESEKIEIVETLSQILEINEEKISELILNSSRNSYRPIILKANVNYLEALKLMTKIDSLAGVNLVTSYYRDYYMPIDEDNYSYHSHSHILGYTGIISETEKQIYQDYLLTDKIGKSGLEKQYESELRGVYGKEKIEVDVIGKIIKVINQQPPIAGKDLVLNIDLDIQIKAEEILKNKMDSIGIKKATMIIMDPQTGGIISIVSLPSFNNNIFSFGVDGFKYNELINDETKPLFFRALLGEYPSGSTFKPVVAAAALEEGIIDEKTWFNSIGGIRIGQWFFPDWKLGGHGRSNVIRAISESINTYFYTIGGGYENFTGLGVDKIRGYAELFGLNSPTGIDFPFESKGFIPTKEWKEQRKGERWYVGDTYHISIGQGDILVTPLQVANYTSVFANGGTLYHPRFIKGFYQEGGLELIDPIVSNSDFIGSPTINTVKKGMRESVLSGSSQYLNSLPFSSAGKTGTAQWSSQGPPHAWFTCFAPYETPQFVITVLLEEGLEGSTNAVPVAYDMLKWLYDNDFVDN